MDISNEEQEEVDAELLESEGKEKYTNEAMDLVHAVLKMIRKAAVALT
jgi:H2-forming N5,N10-methylenetetrahydromethanopterin dehydrogenase-like enzyme